MITEPVHDFRARDTSVSASEGRLKLDIAGKRKKKRKLLKKILKCKK